MLFGNGIAGSETLPFWIRVSCLSWYSICGVTLEGFVWQGTLILGEAAALEQTYMPFDCRFAQTGWVMQVLAANEQSHSVNVICRDAGMLERGEDVRALGVNLLIADFFDSGPSGNLPQAS